MDKVRQYIGVVVLRVALRILPKDMRTMIENSIKKYANRANDILKSALTGDPLTIDIDILNDSKIVLIDTVLMKAPYIEIDEIGEDGKGGLVYSTSRNATLKISLLPK